MLFSRKWFSEQKDDFINMDVRKEDSIANMGVVQILRLQFGRLEICATILILGEGSGSWTQPYEDSFRHFKKIRLI